MIWIIKYSLIYASSIHWVMMFFGWLLLSWIWLDFVSRSQGIEDEWARGVTDEETYQNFLSWVSKQNRHFLAYCHKQTQRFKLCDNNSTLMPRLFNIPMSPFSTAMKTLTFFNIQYCTFAGDFQTPIKVLFYNKMHWLEKISLSPAQMLHISSL